MKSSIASLVLSAFLAITSMPSELAAQSDKAKKIILGVAGAIIANEILRNQPSQGAETNGGQTRISAQAATSGATSYHSSLSKVDRAEIQKELNQLGFNVGVADGVFGRKTHLGVTEFQKKYGYEVTGTITEEQRVVLRRALSESADLLPLPERKLSSREVRFLQTALRQLGYYRSAIDGVAGRGTGSAVVQFLNDRQLDANQTDARAALIMAMSDADLAIPPYLNLELGGGEKSVVSSGFVRDHDNIRNVAPPTSEENVAVSSRVEDGASGNVRQIEDHLDKVTLNECSSEEVIPEALGFNERRLWEEFGLHFSRKDGLVKNGKVWSVPYVSAIRSGGPAEESGFRLCDYLRFRYMATEMKKETSLDSVVEYFLHGLDLGSSFEGSVFPLHVILENSKNHGVFLTDKFDVMNRGATDYSHLKREIVFPLVSKKQLAFEALSGLALGEELVGRGETDGICEGIGIKITSVDRKSPAYVLGVRAGNYICGAHYKRGTYFNAVRDFNRDDGTLKLRVFSMPGNGGLRTVLIERLDQESAVSRLNEAGIRVSRVYNEALESDRWRRAFEGILPDSDQARADMIIEFVEAVSVEADRSCYDGGGISGSVSVTNLRRDAWSGNTYVTSRRENLYTLHYHPAFSNALSDKYFSRKSLLGGIFYGEDIQRLIKIFGCDSLEFRHLELQLIEGAP